MSAKELLKLEAPEQMKAILATQERLPLSLIFIDVEWKTDSSQERWVPLSPHISPLWDLDTYFEAYLTSRGLLLRSSHINSGIHTIGFRIPVLEGSSWMIKIAGNSGPWSWKRFVLPIKREELNRCLPEGVSCELIVILDKSCPYVVSPNKGLGACFLPTGTNDSGEETVRYISPVQWQLRQNPLREADGLYSDVNLLQPGGNDVLLSAG
jgi:hypothetical protein